MWCVGMHVCVRQRQHRSQVGLKLSRKEGNLQTDYLCIISIALPPGILTFYKNKLFNLDHIYAFATENKSTNSTYIIGDLQESTLGLGYLHLGDCFRFWHSV
jgi:hypothetical protein